MSLSSILGAAAADPMAGAAVAPQSADPGASAPRGAVFGQAQEVAQLLASLQPHLGRNVSTTA